MKRMSSGALWVLAVFAFFSPAPAEALCSGICGGTQECPECAFSAFFSYHCADRPCRWCAEFECTTAAPSTPADQLAHSLRDGNAAPGMACSALGSVEIGDPSAPVRVVRLEARL